MNVEMREKACRTCHIIVSGKSQCPNCKTYTLSPSYTGEVIIRSEDSQIAKRLNLSKKGKYALRVR